MTHDSVSEEQKEAVESILNGSSDWGYADWNRAVSSLVELLVHERQAGAENAARAVQDAMWHALLFKSRCHNTRLEGATSYPCVCCEDAVKKVGDAGIAAAAPFLKGK